MSQAAKIIAPQVQITPKASTVKPTVVSTAKPKRSSAPKPTLSVVTSKKANTGNASIQAQALELSRSAVFLCDLNWNVTFANATAKSAFAELLPKLQEANDQWNSVDADEIEGLSFGTFFVDEPTEYKNATDARYHPYEKTILVGANSISFRVDSITDASGTPTTFVVDWKDVTEQEFTDNRSAQFLSALTGSSVCVMLADTELRPFYMNDRLTKSLKEWEPEFQKVYGPGFRADGIFGRCIDEFHKDPAHQRRLLANESIFPYMAQIKVGPLRIELAVNVIKDKYGKTVGYTTEWNDITERLKAEEDYKDQVKAIADRMEFLRANCATDLSNAMEALSRGDFSLEVTPATPLLEIPSQPDLALMAETFNLLRDKTVATVMAYNQTKDDLAKARADKEAADIEYKKEVQIIADRMELLRSACSTDLASAMESMANGDLTMTITPSTPALEIPEQPDLALMAQTFNGVRDQSVAAVLSYNKAQASLSALIAQVQVSATHIADSSNEVAIGNDDLAQRTEEQAASLEETASSMEEMTSTVKQNADNAKQANHLAMQARESAERGGQVVTNAVSTMEEINMASKRISDIISVIDEIAFQTNLLALNAAVEAARVGEQGRGFAVVAAEVRNLAGRSATAAKEIKALVQDSVQKVQEGSALVNQSGGQLDEIVNSVKKVADIIAEITAAAQEQYAGIEQVNRAIIQMDQITQQNAALVEEASAASQSMNRQAADLQTVVEKFELDPEHVSQLQAQFQATQVSEVNGAKQASRVKRPIASTPEPRAVRRAKPPTSARSTDLDDFEEF